MSEKGGFISTELLIDVSHSDGLFQAWTWASTCSNSNFFSILSENFDFFSDYTRLSDIWLASRLNKPLTLFEGDGKETAKPQENMTLGQFLLEIRGAEFDVSRNPERSYQTLVERKKFVWWTNFLSILCVISLAISAIVGVLRNYYGTATLNTLDLTLIGCLTVCMITGITLLIVHYFRERLKISTATKLIGEMWSHVRDKYDEVGLIEVVAQEASTDSRLAGRILRAHTLPEQLNAGPLLRDLFKKHFVHVGVPYVKSQESGVSQDEAAARRVKGKFDLMDLLTGHMGFGEHPGAVRTRAYEAARRKIQEEDETQKDEGKDDETTKIIRFPTKEEGKKFRPFTPEDGPPPPEAA
jgi:hypothetical protein